MYQPTQHVQHDRVALVALMRAYPFATVIAPLASGLEINHLPLLVEPQGEGICLVGHLAVGNRLATATDVTAVFHGPHAYISAAWYGEADTVPTWNYQVVHAHGHLELIHEAAEQRRILHALANHLEGRAAAQWQQRLSPAVAERLQAGISFFRISIRTLDGKWKLSQQHHRDRRERVIAALRTAGDRDGLAIAAAMQDGMQDGLPPPSVPT